MFTQPITQIPDSSDNHGGMKLGSGTAYKVMPSNQQEYQGFVYFRAVGKDNLIHLTKDGKVVPGLDGAFTNVNKAKKAIDDYLKKLANEKQEKKSE